MLKMKVNSDITTKLDNLGKRNEKSDIDISYLNGIVDTFRYVGGDLEESFTKHEERNNGNLDEIIPTMKKLSIKTQAPFNHHDLKFELLEYRAKISKRNEELKSATLKLMDKNMEIDNFRLELEHKNIQLSLKDQEISKFTMICESENDDIWMRNTSRLRNELCATQEKLSDKQDEVNMMRRELEQRNILLSRVDNRLKEMHLL